MEDKLLMGIGRHTVRVPPAIWRRHVRGSARLEFMTAEHHRVRDHVVTELPRTGAPLSPGSISRALDLPQNRVVDILVDLEAQMTFLFRDEQGSVEWAYPVTAARTPHRTEFSSGERINAA